MIRVNTVLWFGTVQPTAAGANYPIKRVKPFLSVRMIIIVFRPFFLSKKNYNGVSQEKGVIKMSKQTNMTKGNPTKLLLSFAIPPMLGTIFQQSFIIVDRIIGAGKMDRIKQGLFVALKICAIYSLILLFIFWGFGKVVMNIFVSDITIIENAVKGIHITSIFFMALGILQILRYLLNGTGDSVYSMVNGILEIICRLVFVFILTNISFIGQGGIWWTTAFTWFCTALFSLWRYKSGRWKQETSK